MAEFEFLKMLKGNVIDTISETLLDPNAQNQILIFKTQLTEKAKQLVFLNHQTNMIKGKNSSYLDNLNMIVGATANYGNNQIEINAQAKQEAIIKEIFLLIHNILDFLSKGQTATKTYAIYYNTDDQREKGEFIRREVSSKTLYNSSALTVLSSGIVLKRSSLSELFGKLNTLEQQFGSFSIHSTSGVYQKLVEEAIKEMITIFDEMDKEIQWLRGEAKKQHLGEDRWKRYMYLRDLKNWNEKGQEIYKKYMLKSQYGSLRRASFSRGHIGEAYERYLQHGGTDYGSLFKESLGNLPWYAGGDIDDIQVKTLFTNTSQSGKEYDPQVQIASMQSILGLTYELILLLNPNTEEINQNLENQINNDFNQAQIDKKLYIYNEKVAQRLIKEGLKT